MRYKLLLLGGLAMIGAAACDPGTTEPEAAAAPAPFAPQSAFLHGFDGFSTAVDVETIPGTSPEFNTDAAEGCPFVSRDGKSFYMASDRGGKNNMDIWVSTRPKEGDPWGEPVNVGAPINTPQPDFCPTIARDGHTFYFVSVRPDSCGGGDIYVSRVKNGVFAEPEHLPCGSVNSSANEFSPFPMTIPGRGPVLFFSSFRAGGFDEEDAGEPGDSDLYMSESHGGVFGPAELIPGVNSVADDGQPNVRRDGLELFFYSTRTGAEGADIYHATRRSAHAPWGNPVNLGSDVNSPGSETTPSLSWDGTTLYFGSTRAGSGDIYRATRVRN